MESPEACPIPVDPSARERRSTRKWMSVVLHIAGVYNLLWGASVVLMPGLAFSVLGLEPPLYPSIWRCVGMIVGVYGIGYLIAAGNPIRHWPIVLVGLLGKIFGPIGFIVTASSGELPWSLGWTILTNDLIWWAPFAMILWAAARHHTGAAEAGEGSPISPEDALSRVRLGNGETLAERTTRRDALVVLLRHAGCTFCREALADLGSRRAELEANADLVLVHMGPPGGLDDALPKYGLQGVATVSDQDRVLYGALGLQRGGFLQLFGPRVWWRGLSAGLLGGHGVGALQGDGMQMPGAFLVRRGRVARAFRHRSAADRPDYVGLSKGDRDDESAPPIAANLSTQSPLGGST